MDVIKYIKKKNGLYDIVFDNNEKISIHEDLILKYDLLTKKNVDNKKLNNILEENIYYLAYSDTIKFIGKKMRSIFEVEEYLKKNNIDEEKTNKIVSKIIKQGYLNDSEYAKAFVNDRMLLSNDGPNKIASSLRQNKIDEDIICIVLEKFNVDEQKSRINKFIEKQLKLNNDKGSNLLKQKIIINLVNLGYDRTVIINCLDMYDIDDTDIYKKEYKKIYEKLSKKYSGKELEYRVKQKLYQKGFIV